MSENSAIRAILAMGAFLITLMGLLALIMRGTLGAGDPPGNVGTPRAQSPFDSERAWRDLERVLDFGPRPPGSEALAELREYIKAELTATGLPVRQQDFIADTPLGEIPMANIVATVQGTDPGVVILGNHYDTKLFTDFVFVGANDAGSTTAWMLEMARALGPTREGHTVWLCFFDGEEALVEWTEDDSLYGSRHFVEQLQKDGQADDVVAMINVDMIGDCHLDIRRDREGPAWLVNLIWEKAHELGYGEHFLPLSERVLDDHIPFRRAGIDATNLIDFRYGATPEDHRLNWHTERDTIDKVCAGSLQVVGDVVYHSLHEIDARSRGLARQRQAN